MKTDALRTAYLEYFRTKEHKLFSSDSLVPADDPSLLFTGAGMNQFKAYFLGQKKDVKRASSCQKCLRTADLDRVGKTAYHHSFFEMLGNFSFGDYFKEGAIEWGWGFVTKALGLPAHALWVSVYQDDDEAFEIWKRKIGLPEARIVRMGAEDNFWPSNAPTDGPNGPCGPCSEIYVGTEPGKGVEIWNLVFTQFDRQSDGSLPPLPQKNIDTGMGLERTAAVLQNVGSNFDTDNFVRLRAELHRLLSKGGVSRASENAVMDHIRAVTFSIADGALPSNEGRGYVIRKIIRLGTDHLIKAGAVDPASFHKLVPAVVGIYGSVYPEIADRQKTIASIIENEEKAFLEISRTRGPEFKKALQQAPNDPAQVAALIFKYYDTYGLPYENIQTSAADIGRPLTEVHAKAFQALLEEQKERSRGSSKLAGEIFSKSSVYTLVDGLGPTQFLGYKATEEHGCNLLRCTKGDNIVPELKAGEEGVLLFDKSPFYAESGGQIGDKGLIRAPGFEAEVVDTQKMDHCIGHRVSVKQGVARPGIRCQLTVDAVRRADIMKNHTATHLLHAALRRVLGDHVKQSGSLVAPDYLRFDFTHFQAVGPEKIAEIESLVNAEVKKNTSLLKRELAKEEAMREGAMAFFGEKYGDVVRVVSIGDFSKELCGGTHLTSTGEIGLFKITSEGSIQAGVRRIEGVTGRWAQQLVAGASAELESLSREFGAMPDELKARLRTLADRIAASKAKLGDRALSRLRAESGKWLAAAPELRGAKLVVRSVPDANAELLQKAYEHLKGQGVPFAALWRFGGADKVTFVCAGSPDVVQAGFNAGKIIKEVAAFVGGNGGGKPELAIGGGKDAAKAEEAMKKGEALVRAALEAR